MRYVWIGLGCALALSAGVALGQTTPAPAVSATDPAVLAKLDEVLATQETILGRLDAIDAELQIIKVRASRPH